MKTIIELNTQQYTIDLAKPLDISIALNGAATNPNAWYLDAPSIDPVVNGDWVGAVASGGSVNFNTITFNPHAHGTHTECVGHITAQFNSVNDVFSRYFFTAELISVTPEKSGKDYIITQAAISDALKGQRPEALVIRTLPNSTDKLQRQYSHTNWPYLTKDAAAFLCRIGIQHLLIDTPSVDKEKDEGVLAAHNAFWDVKSHPRLHATITEFIYVPDTVVDGPFIIEMQVANMVNDAAPSRPLLYALIT